MTTGRRSRRTSTGFAALTIAVVTGCHSVPVARIAPRPNSSRSTLTSMGRATLLPATVAMDPPSEMSSIEPVSSSSASEPSPGRLELAGTAPPTAQPTPLLDAALAKAKGVEVIVAEEIARSATPPSPPPEPTPTPEPSPTLPPAAPISSSPTPEPPKPDPAPIPAPEPPREPKPAEPSRPEDLWRDGVRHLLGLARERVDRADDSSTPWSLRARVLACLAGPDIVPDLGPGEVEGVRAVLKALEDDPDAPRRQGEDFRSAIRVIEDRAPLEIVDLRFCRKVESFGDFEAFDSPVYKAGQRVILYAEVDGLHHEPDGSRFRTRLAGQFEILSEGGGPPLLTQTLGTAEEACRRRRRDYYVPYPLNLPRNLAPGDYRLRLTEKDLASDRSATREIAFAIARD